MDFQCRECRAGLEQAKNASVAFRCPEHGLTELSIEHLVAGAILVERNSTVAYLRSMAKVADEGKDRLVPLDMFGSLLREYAEVIQARE